VTQALETLVRYAQKEAAERREAGRPSSLFRSFWNPFKRFAGNYLWRLGFLDGAKGLILSSLVSFNLWLSESLLWEAERSMSPEKRP
jgi:hypothetical protein